MSHGITCAACFLITWGLAHRPLSRVADAWPRSNASLEAAAVLRDHSNSLSAVYASDSMAYTGDWDGHVCMWDVSSLGGSNAGSSGDSAKVGFEGRGHGGGR